MAETAIRIEVGGAAWNVPQSSTGVLVIVMPEMLRRTRARFVAAIGRRSGKARLRQNQQHEEDGANRTHRARSIAEGLGQRTGRAVKNAHGHTACVGLLFRATGVPWRKEKNGSHGGGVAAERTPASAESALSRFD